jgi:hypothetical protein
VLLVSAPPGRLSIDLVQDPGQTWCNPIDSSRSVAAGEQYRVAVCVVDQQAPLTGFEVRYAYDPAFDRAPECAPAGTLQCGHPDDQGTALDDNPDANAGASTFSTPYLGDGWDCGNNGPGRLAPKGNNPGTTEADIYINCAVSAAAPDARITGTRPIALITFEALESGQLDASRELTGGAGAGLRGPRRVLPVAQPPTGGAPWAPGSPLEWTGLALAAWAALVLTGGVFVIRKRH